MDNCKSAEQNIEKDTNVHDKKSTYTETTHYQAFYQDIQELVQKYKSKGTYLKIKHDDENNIIRITSEQSTPKSRAINGLEDIIELAQATAEHHPYWGLLSNSAEIVNTTLDKWNDTMTDKDIEDIKWYIQKIEYIVNNNIAIEKNN